MVWFTDTLLPRLAPVSMAELLATLVLIFAFQADNITSKSLHVLLVYFNSSLTYGLMRLFRVRHAVATAIALFGPGSGAALATVVGVLIEVPVMLSACSVCNRTRHWFPAVEGAA